MADLVRKIAYFKVETPDKPGEGARILGALKGAGVNLLAFTGFPRGRRAQMDFVPEDAAAFKQAARKIGLKAGPPKAGFLIQGSDRPGAIADIAAKLAGAKINITAVDAVSAGDGCYAALLWVKANDVRKAAKLLKAG